MRLEGNSFSAKITSYEVEGSWSDRWEDIEPLEFKVSCDPLFTLQEISIPETEDITIEFNRLVYKGGLCLETTKMVSNCLLA